MARKKGKFVWVYLLWWRSHEHLRSVKIYGIFVIVFFPVLHRIQYLMIQANVNYPIIQFPISIISLSVTLNISKIFQIILIQMYRNIVYFWIDISGWVVSIRKGCTESLFRCVCASRKRYHDIYCLFCNRRSVYEW